MYTYAFVNNIEVAEKYSNQLNTYEVIIDDRLVEDRMILSNSRRTIDLAEAMNEMNDL